MTSSLKKLAITILGALFFSGAHAFELALDTTQSAPDARYFRLESESSLRVDLRHQRTPEQLADECESIDLLVDDDEIADDMIRTLHDNQPATLRVLLPEFVQDRGRQWREAFESAGADAAALVVVFESGFVPRAIEMSIYVGGELPDDRRALAIDEFREVLELIPPANLDSILELGYLEVAVDSPIVSCWLHREQVDIGIELTARALKRVEAEWIVNEETILRALNFTNAEFPRHVAASGGRVSVDRTASVLFSSALTNYTGGVLSPEINERANRLISEWLKISESRLNYVLSSTEQQSLITIFRDDREVAALVTYKNSGKLGEVR